MNYNFPSPQKYLQEKQELRRRKEREDKLQKERVQREKEERLKELMQRQRNMATSARGKQQRTQQLEAHQDSLSSPATLPLSVVDMAFVSFVCVCVCVSVCVCECVCVCVSVLYVSVSCVSVLFVSVLCVYLFAHQVKEQV